MPLRLAPGIDGMMAVVWFEPVFTQIPGRAAFVFGKKNFMKIISSVLFKIPYNFVPDFR